MKTWKVRAEREKVFGSLIELYARLRVMTKDQFPEKGLHNSCAFTELKMMKLDVIGKRIINDKAYNVDQVFIEKISVHRHYHRFSQLLLKEINRLEKLNDV